MDYKKLMDDHIAFAIPTFKNSTAFSSLLKLRTEIEEVEIEMLYGTTKMFLPAEYADCMMCILDSAARAGILPNEIMIAFAEKLEINKLREWVENPDHTYSHVKKTIA